MSSRLRSTEEALLTELQGIQNRVQHLATQQRLTAVEKESHDSGLRLQVALQQVREKLDRTSAVVENKVAKERGRLDAAVRSVSSSEKTSSKLCRETSAVADELGTHVADLFRQFARLRERVATEMGEGGATSSTTEVDRASSRAAFQLLDLEAAEPPRYRPPPKLVRSAEVRDANNGGRVGALVPAPPSVTTSSGCQCDQRSTLSCAYGQGAPFGWCKVLKQPDCRVLMPDVEDPAGWDHTLYAKKFNPGGGMDIIPTADSWDYCTPPRMAESETAHFGCQCAWNQEVLDRYAHLASESTVSTTQEKTSGSAGVLDDGEVGDDRKINSSTTRSTTSSSSSARAGGREGKLQLVFNETALEQIPLRDRHAVRIMSAINEEESRASRGSSGDHLEGDDFDHPGRGQDGATLSDDQHGGGEDQEEVDHGVSSSSSFTRQETQEKSTTRKLCRPIEHEGQKQFFACPVSEKCLQSGNVWSGRSPWFSVSKHSWDFCNPGSALHDPPRRDNDSLDPRIVSKVKEQQEAGAEQDRNIKVSLPFPRNQTDAELNAEDKSGMLEGDAASAENVNIIHNHNYAPPAALLPGPGSVAGGAPVVGGVSAVPFNSINVDPQIMNHLKHEHEDHPTSTEVNNLKIYEHHDQGNNRNKKIITTTTRRSSPSGSATSSTSTTRSKS